jgi:GH24 family phage-related lysozyme (muramidase)
VSTYLEQSLVKLKEFEGCVPWMYRDTVGKVTVAVGLMLPDASAAAALPFVSTSGTATSEQIEAEFARVQALPLGRTSSFYKIPTSPQLTQAAIDAKLTAVLQGFESDLRARMQHYDHLPDPAKLALLDMIYNLGPQRLFSEFPHLIQAVEAGSWAQAAENCLRRGPSAARNAWTRQQFLSAVVTSIKAESEHWLTRIWWRIRQMFNGSIHRRA